MAKKEAVVVGAGLSGLSACISAAKLGYEVTCLNMFSREGGVPESYPTMDATPLDPTLMSRWLGVPIGEPYVGMADLFRIYGFGKPFDLKSEVMGLHIVERGTRSTAIDHYLYEKAVEMGVKFEFNHPILSQKELAELPPNTIIAAGPYAHMFSLLNIPNEMAYGYLARGVLKEGSERSKQRFCIVHFDYYTKDYAYVAAANGLLFGLLFSRKPVGEKELEIWEKQLRDDEGLEFNYRDLQQGPFRSRYPSSPTLFQGNFILCGTIAAAQDPGTYFGVHGGLVSGKIAAIALEDKGVAQEMFNICNRSFNMMWFGRRLAINYAPDWGRKIAITNGLKVQSGMPALDTIAGPAFKNMIPGYTLLNKYMEKRYSKWL